MNYKECAYFSLYKQSPRIYKNYTFEISSSISSSSGGHLWRSTSPEHIQTNTLEHTRSTIVVEGQGGAPSRRLGGLGATM